MEQKFITNSKSNSSLGWNNYWQNSSGNNAFEKGGPSETVLLEQWGNFFQQTLTDGTSHKMLDIGCGNGVVTHSAIQLLASMNHQQTEIVCVDLSRNGIQAIQQQFPQVRAVNADANHMPFQDASFDIIVSQFGVEYAVQSGFKEAIRVLADKGELVFILHLKDGMIFNESESNLSMVQQFLETELIPKSRELFHIAFDLIQSKATLDEFKAADEKLSVAVNKAKKLLSVLSPYKFTENLIKIFQDIAHINSNLEAFKEKEVLYWLDDNENELNDYAERTRAMLDVAMDERDFDKLITLFKKQGLFVLEKEKADCK